MITDNNSHAPMLRELHIIFLEDTEDLIEGLKLMLRRDNINVIATTRNPDGILSLVEKYRPDAVVIDLHIHPFDEIEGGLRALANIKRQDHTMKCIIRTGLWSQEHLDNAFVAAQRLGAEAFVLAYESENPPLGRLIRMVVDEHAMWYDRNLRMRTWHSFTRPNPLTPRETIVARFLVHRKTNKEIASALGISEGVVKDHVGEILRKTDADNRNIAADTLMKYGWIW